jgi:NAD(P)-dependent dehydrogenase (short-subunit alcohol dehydrogenase family)
MPTSRAQLPDLTGTTVVVTGASSGIGAISARSLSDAGATVVPVGRSPEATAAIGRELGVEALIADYADLSQVRTLAARILDRCPQIDVMLHNAGGFVTKKIETVDGHELMFQANHLAPFLLQSLLHERIVATPNARIIVTSSSASNAGHVDIDDLDWRNRRFSPSKVYGTSKLENILFAKELARRLDGTSVTATAVHPGAVATNFMRDAGIFKVVTAIPILRSRIFISPEEGAAPLLHLATWPDASVANGRYYDRLKADGKTSTQAADPTLARALWDKSVELSGAVA